MLTELGMKKLKTVLIKMGRRGDDEWNVIIQTAVIAINRLIERRFPSA